MPIKSWKSAVYSDSQPGEEECNWNTTHTEDFLAEEALERNTVKRSFVWENIFL